MPTIGRVRSAISLLRKAISWLCPTCSPRSTPRGNRVDAAPAPVDPAEVARVSRRCGALSLPSCFSGRGLPRRPQSGGGTYPCPHAATSAPFALSAEAWPVFVAYLNRVSGNVLPASAATAHADHLAMQAQVR